MPIEAYQLGYGCNCAGAMGKGKGIALQFRSRFPQMYTEYKRRCNSGQFTLGDVFTWVEPDGLVIFNLGTQVTWRDRAGLSAIKNSVERMIQIAEAKKIPRIGLPKIGAGLGGLLWNDVKTLLSNIGSCTGIELCIFEEFVPHKSV